MPSHIPAAASVNVEAKKVNLNDTLGEFIQLDTTLYLDSESWHDFYNKRRGRSNFSPHLRSLRHKAATLLHRFSTTGVPVLLSSKPWTLQQKDDAMRRGNHPSAHAFAEYLREEFGDMRQQGMFLVLPYELVRHLPQLRLSPIGCIPQRERRPRTIIDYTYSGVNDSTLKLAPQESMQWGRTLQRLLWMIHTADRRQGPVLMSKTDLSDGFYQYQVTASGALMLATPFPSGPGEPPLVSIPTRLPMGWTESPPNFSAGTETIADLANEALETSVELPPPHPLEHLADSPAPMLPSSPDLFPIQDTGPLRPKLAYVDVYVDDFCKLAQGQRNCDRTRRVTYHTIDSVFRPNDTSDIKRRQPISTKKLLKGDDSWESQKVILGWLIDSLANSLALPAHRQEKLLSLLTNLLHRNRTSVADWHTLLGELRSMSLAVPGSRGCFSFLQHALRPGCKRIKITKAVRDQLKDFLWLATDVSARPTHLSEIVPTPPTYFGAVDAAKVGMGGVWFPPGPAEPLAIQPRPQDRLQGPILWRDQFPPIVQKKLVSFDNPRGTISNSDLELAGTIAHDDILASTVPLHHLTTCSFTDNTPAVAWRSKGSTTTTGPAAYLLQLSALHQRHFRYKPEVHYLPGTANAMADDCSRLWNLTDTQLIAYFNSNYPQPSSWTLHRLRPEMRSSLISSLLRKRSPPESYLPESERPRKLGRSGLRFAPASLSTRMFRRWPTLSLSSRPSPSVGEMDASHPVATQTELARWRMPYGLSVRRWPVWGPKTLG